MHMTGSSNTSRYEREYLETLDRIRPACRILPELQYFLDTEYTWAQHQAKPEIVILGTAVPEELVLAAGAMPYWLTGGSLISTEWSDDEVPRDTDPVSRSILGHIHQPDGTDFSDALFLIPLTGDSMRKIAYQLKAEGRRLCLADIPPDRNAPGAAARWQRQMLEMTRTVAEHTGNRVTRGTLLAAMQQVTGARRALTAFLHAAQDRPDLLPEPARLLVQDSYYRTYRLEEWTFRLQVLTERIRLLSRQTPGGNCPPGVLLLGSPVVFPNYKIPFLIRDAGLHLTDTVDSAALKRHLLYKTFHGSRDRLIRQIAAAWYAHDASPAFVRNDAMLEYLAKLAENREIEGVVYHVLKGQIEQDFELERAEALLALHGIPVFRLETDYQYQDIEQLRIRLEAFSEMLTQNRFKEVKTAI